MAGENVDRISELPDFILHTILSMLDTKKACRATVLSKRWYGAWSSVPVLDFQPRYFKDYRKFLCQFEAMYFDDTIERYVGFIDKTMQRYFTQKYRITKLCLTLHKTENKLLPLIDQWVSIAVQNQIQELDINVIYRHGPEYKLPEILFRAKSLRVFKCRHMGIPYYETIELISLKCLTIVHGSVNEDMLQRIIAFCPLVHLNITHYHLKNISLPWMRKVNEGDECFGRGLESRLKASPLTSFVYNSSYGEGLPWSWNMNLSVLKNLRKLEIVEANITDDIVSELAYRLVVLESLVLSGCRMLKCIKISSISLKEFRFESVFGLITTATIDSPNLLELKYYGEVEASVLLIRAQDHCNAELSPLLCSYQCITINWFVKLKVFLIEANYFKSLVINLCLDMPGSDQTVVKTDQLRDVTDPPYKLRELKLLDTDDWARKKSPLKAFLDGLFWICHPDVLSITTHFENETAKLIMNILKHRWGCWKHFLKNIELEGVYYPSLLSESSELIIKFRLSWLSV